MNDIKELKKLTKWAKKLKLFLEDYDDVWVVGHNKYRNNYEALLEKEHKNQPYIFEDLNEVSNFLLGFGEAKGLKIYEIK